MQCRGGTADDDDEDAWGYVTYCVERALPVVGDVGLAFRRFLEDPFVTFIRGHLSHQPACRKEGGSKTQNQRPTGLKHIIHDSHACVCMPQKLASTTVHDGKAGSIKSHAQNTQSG
jgi:hypothetical protein